MTDREKLIGLTSSYFAGFRVIDMVDYLIDNGVTVQKTRAVDYRRCLCCLFCL